MCDRYSSMKLDFEIIPILISSSHFTDRVVDELNPEMNLTKKEVESLLEFDESDMPYEDFSHVAEKFPDIILKNICTEHSNNLSKVKMVGGGIDQLLCPCHT